MNDVTAVAHGGANLAGEILLNARIEEISLERGADYIIDVLRYAMVIEPSVFVSKATDTPKVITYGYG